jgi:hypothetical protein
VAETPPAGDAGAVVDDLVAHLESGQRRAEPQLVRFFDLSIDLFRFPASTATSAA